MRASRVSGGGRAGVLLYHFPTLSGGREDRRVHAQVMGRVYHLLWLGVF